MLLPSTYTDWSSCYNDTLTLLGSWANNCAANNETNGVDYLTEGATSSRSSAIRQPRAALAAQTSQGVGIPSQFYPNLTAIAGGDILWSYVLPDKRTGVVRSISVCPSMIRLERFILSADVRRVFRPRGLQWVSIAGRICRFCIPGGRCNPVVD